MPFKLCLWKALNHLLFLILPPDNSFQSSYFPFTQLKPSQISIIHDLHLCLAKLLPLFIKAFLSTIKWINPWWQTSDLRSRHWKQGCLWLHSKLMLWRKICLGSVKSILKTALCVCVIQLSYCVFVLFSSDTNSSSIVKESSIPV